MNDFWISLSFNFSNSFCDVIGKSGQSSESKMETGPPAASLARGDVKFKFLNNNAISFSFDKDSSSKVRPIEYSKFQINIFLRNIKRST